MSDLAPVSFELSPYKFTQMPGFTDCLAIVAMQVGSGEALQIKPWGEGEQGASTSSLEVDLPERLATNIRLFLETRDAMERFRKRKGWGNEELPNRNCHTATAIGKGWLDPLGIDAGLLTQHYRLGFDEVRPVPLDEYGALQSGEVYVLAHETHVTADGIQPDHSILALPGEEGLHFSVLGRKGSAHVARLIDPMRWYNAPLLFHVPERPRDIGTDAWRVRAEEVRPPAWAEGIAANVLRATRVLQALGGVPTANNVHPEAYIVRPRQPADAVQIA